MGDSMRVLLIIPAYNEAESIGAVVDDLIANHPAYDYVVVNDCSSDRTEAICREHGYNYLSQPVNLGIGGTVQSGYLYAHEQGYDIAVQLDGDGQHDPAYLSALLVPIEAGSADFTIGSRFLEKEGFQTSAPRRMGIVVMRGVIRLCCGVTVTDTTSGFRAVNKPLIEYFAHEYAQDYPEPEAIVTAALQGFRVTEVPVQMRERAGGQSSINTLRSVYYMIKVSLSLLMHRLGTRRKRTNPSG